MIVSWMQMVRWLIEDKEIDVHAVNQANETALYFAARSGRTENVRVLIEHGARVDQRRLVSGRTPFLIAALNGRAEVCEFMLANGYADLLACGTETIRHLELNTTQIPMRTLMACCVIRL
jgi:ankyrin repeat protein